MLPKNMPGATATLSLVLMCGALLIWQDHLEPRLNAVGWERRLGEVADNAAVLKGTNVSRANLTLRGAGPVAQREKMVAHIDKEGVNSPNFSKNVTISDPMTVNKTLALRRAAGLGQVGMVLVIARKFHMSLSSVINDLILSRNGAHPAAIQYVWDFHRMRLGIPVVHEFPEGDIIRVTRVGKTIHGPYTARDGDSVTIELQNKVCFSEGGPSGSRGWRALTLFKQDTFSAVVLGGNCAKDTGYVNTLGPEYFRHHTLVLTKATRPFGINHNMADLYDAIEMTPGAKYIFEWLK
ncbi:unnamed protein product [Symbiodinium sp. CCMP2592]|nr:unnamed protein product [Symbiodinium sp. CCMP2592]